MRAGVARAAEERQGAFDDTAVIGADPAVHLAEPVRVVPGVGEDDIRAVPQQQPVGELLVDDTDIAGDDDGRVSASRQAWARPCSIACTAPPTQASTMTS